MPGSCNDLKNAIRLAEDSSGNIDILITDVVVPEMNGLELVKRSLSLLIEPEIIPVHVRLHDRCDRSPWRSGLGSGLHTEDAAMNWNKVKEPDPKPAFHQIAKEDRRPD